MNWKAVASSLRNQAGASLDEANDLLSRQPSMLSSDWKAIERCRINATVCLSLAEAIEAGIREET